MSNSSCLKIRQNLLGVLYTLVHLAHFSYTVSVIPLYNDTNFIFLISYMFSINHIFNSLVKKMMDDLGSIFFPQISLMGKILEFSCEG